MSIEVMRQARNAFVWNLNTDLDNISACEQWAKMLRKNIDDLDKAIADAMTQDYVPAQRPWVGLTEDEIQELRLKSFDAIATNHEIYRTIEAKLKERNHG